MARKPSGWSKLAWWGRGVLAAWQPPRKPRARRSAAESIAADLTIRRRASGLFVLTFAWNDFVVAVAMVSSAEVRTLPLAIYNYLGFFGREWGPLTASAMLPSKRRPTK